MPGYKLRALDYQLTPYEACVALGVTQWKEHYPMDYYSKESTGTPDGAKNKMGR